jgi:hypothetical protein
MYFNSTPTSIREASQVRQDTGHVVYRGRTTNTNATEIFIEGAPNRRLCPAYDSSVLLEVVGVAHYSNGTTLHTASHHLYRVSPTGVITAVDLDGTTAAAQGVELAGSVGAASGAVVPKLNVLALGAANGYTLTVVPATTTTRAYIALSVSSSVAGNTDWEFKVSFVEAGGRN